MKPKLSQKAIELYDDECVDAGGVDIITAGDAIFVFMNIINKKTGKNIGFDLTKIEDLFLLFINSFYAKIFKFCPCDSRQLKVIFKDLAEMGYFGRHESANSNVFWLKDVGTELADEIFEIIPDDVKEITNKIAEIIIEKYIEIRPIKTKKLNFTNSLLIHNESIPDINLKLLSLLSASVVAERNVMQQPIEIHSKEN